MLDLKALLAKILDVLKVDYIVEEGTSGDWTYRKWNSGIAECWCHVHGGWSVAFTSQGSGVYSNTTWRAFTKALPSGLFTSIKETSGSAGTNGYSVFSVSDVTTATFTFRVWNTYATSGMTIYYYSLHVIGTWKTGGGYLVSNLILSSLLRGWHYVRPQSIARQNTKFSYSYTSGDLELHNRRGEHLGKIWQLYNSNRGNISHTRWLQQFCGVWGGLFCHIINLHLASDNYSRKRHGWVNRNSDLLLKRYLYIVDKMSNRVKEQYHIHYKIVNTIIPQRGWCVC